MQARAGNGHNVNLQRLLEDIKTVLKDGEVLLKSSATHVKEGVISRAKSTDKIVHERPYQSLGIMFGAGVVVGLLMASLLRRRED